MDQTALYFETPAKKTIDFKESKLVATKKDGISCKQRFTATITINADGKLLNSFLIFKGLLFIYLFLKIKIGTPNKKIEKSIKSYEKINLLCTVQKNA